jgi:hypothetical protein
VFCEGFNLPAVDIVRCRPWTQSFHKRGRFADVTASSREFVRREYVTSLRHR